MNVPLHAKAQCTDGPGGRVVQAIVNPITGKMTHVVIEESRTPNIERLVPLQAIVDANDDLLYLSCTRQELAQMQPFIESEFMWIEIPDLDESFPYMLHPYVVPSSLTEKQESLPAEELCIRRGAQVQATDGKVGWVDEFVVVPANGEITHLLLREGHLWGCKEVTIPISAIERIEGKTVHLRLDTKRVQALPPVPVQRSWR